MRRPISLLMLPLLFLSRASWSQENPSTPAPGKAVLADVRKIWDRAPHNAFTDLVRFQDRWFCVFREGQGHVSPDGAIRVITSTDGREWIPRRAHADRRRPTSRSQDHDTPDGPAHDRRGRGPGPEAERRGQAPVDGLVLARRPGLGRGS